MHLRRRAFAFLVTAVAVAVTGTVAALAARTSQSSNAVTPKRGGHITIARIEDSQSFDKTNVFQNESIWLTEQINESLYEAGNDGKTLKPWLATGYTKSADGKTYTFTLRKGVKFSNGKPMTAADVKFSIDDARVQKKGWGYLDAAIKSIDAPNPSTVVFHLKFQWAPFVADIALFANDLLAPEDEVVGVEVERLTQRLLRHGATEIADLRQDDEVLELHPDDVLGLATMDQPREPHEQPDRSCWPTVRHGCAVYHGCRGHTSFCGHI